MPFRKGSGHPAGVENVLPETAGWKPQRDTEKAIELRFEGPQGLKPTTKLEIKDPDGRFVPSPTLAF